VKDATPRAFSLTRAAYGAVLLCAPGAVVGWCTGQPASARARAVVRVLGSRHLIQAAVTARAPSALVLRIGAQVDLAHAASMLALGAVGRPLRRAPLADGLVAATFAALGAAGAATRGHGAVCVASPGAARGESSTAQREELPVYIGIGAVVVIVIIVVIVLALRR
jgi:hypothetical protein